MGPKTWPSSATSPSTWYGKWTTSYLSSDGANAPPGIRPICSRSSARSAVNLDSLPWVGPGLPVWSVGFFPDGDTLLTGGADQIIRRWNARSGEPVGAMTIGAPEDPLASYAGEPG